jgi:chromosome segregation ATPase
MRHDAIKIELKRIESCDNDFVDTDVWVGGYMQRTQTSVVVVHLNKEIEGLIEQLNSSKKMLEETEIKLNEVNFDLRKEKRVCDRISVALRLFSNGLQKMTSTSVDQVYIYIYIFVFMHVYIYIYIYIHT